MGTWCKMQEKMDTERVKRQTWKAHQLDSSEESDYASLQSDLESDGSLSTSEEEKFRFLQKQRRKRFRQALNEKNKQKRERAKLGMGKASSGPSLYSAAVLIFAVSMFITRI